MSIRKWKLENIGVKEVGENILSEPAGLTTWTDRLRILCASFSEVWGQFQLRSWNAIILSHFYSQHPVHC